MYLVFQSMTGAGRDGVFTGRALGSMAVILLVVVFSEVYFTSMEERKHPNIEGQILFQTEPDVAVGQGGKKLLDTMVKGGVPAFETNAVKEPASEEEEGVQTKVYIENRGEEEKLVKEIMQLGKTSSPNKRKKYRSMICTITRNDRHLREFIVRHLLAGFSHIVIYDNNQVTNSVSLYFLSTMDSFIFHTVPFIFCMLIINDF